MGRELSQISTTNLLGRVISSTRRIVFFEPPVVVYSIV
jgi:hypothetical protein